MSKNVFRTLKDATEYCLKKKPFLPQMNELADEEVANDQDTGVLVVLNFACFVESQRKEEDGDKRVSYLLP